MWANIGRWLWEIVVPALLTLLLPAVFQAVREWAATVRDERLRRLLEELVRAAEQIYGKERGADKMAYVTGALDELGVKASRPQIEAAVNRLFGKEC